MGFTLVVCTTNTFLGVDLLSSITYAERIKIETFCEAVLSNIHMSLFKLNLLICQMIVIG